MRRFSVFRPALLTLLLTLAAGVQAEALEAALVNQYPAGTIQSVEQASTALLAVTDTRKQVEDDYAATRTACMEKFFMTICFNAAKERRRKALTAIRKVEVEASAWLRKDKADERDRAVAERQRKAALPSDSPAIPFTGAARSESEPNVAAPADKHPEAQPEVQPDMEPPAQPTTQPTKP